MLKTITFRELAKTINNPIVEAFLQTQRFYCYEDNDGPVMNWLENDSIAEIESGLFGFIDGRLYPQFSQYASQKSLARRQLMPWLADIYIKNKQDKQKFGCSDSLDDWKETRRYYHILKAAELSQ